MAARILVVEASHELRMFIADVLKADGHVTSAVTNGAQALGLLEHIVFDLLVSDLTMPALDGAALYREISRRWPQYTSRVICMTDGTGPGRRDHRMLREASVPFLVKPFSPLQLREVVERMLEATQRSATQSAGQAMSRSAILIGTLKEVGGGYIEISPNFHIILPHRMTPAELVLGETPDGHRQQPRGSLGRREDRALPDVAAPMIVHVVSPSRPSGTAHGTVRLGRSPEGGVIARWPTS